MLGVVGFRTPEGDLTIDTVQIGEPEPLAMIAQRT